ncbi:hypothetical protein [Psychrosphaera algicola]|uniref:STAS domain-containing protein n=1 Tax=Psychrosphaera algicola TaxID=3023714 RepID=A0ABT5FI43_9GAMM|nr:hypothetical protein [Psychrosphaera sp. G1-22]MDC2890864.1 hypothetical protein [Psychrosphaera sp. G1-22]
MAQAVSYSDNAVIILELDFAISYVDSKAIAMLKCDRETLLGSRFSVLSMNIWHLFQNK